jgi:hypothetical protein
VLLVAAVVVGRLAVVARERAAEAEARAWLAADREREAKLVAEVASAILAGESVGAPLTRRRPSGRSVPPPSERALGPTAAYLLAHRPCRVLIETPPASGPGNGAGSGRAAAQVRPAALSSPRARAPV